MDALCKELGGAARRFYVVRGRTVGSVDRLCLSACGRVAAALRLKGGCDGACTVWMAFVEGVQVRCPSRGEQFGDHVCVRVFALTPSVCTNKFSGMLCTLPR